MRQLPGVSQPLFLKVLQRPEFPESRGQNIRNLQLGGEVLEHGVIVRSDAPPAALFELMKS